MISAIYHVAIATVIFSHDNMLFPRVQTSRFHAKAHLAGISLVFI